jgi:hypothetical protein
MHITMGGVHRAHGHGGSQEAAPSRGCCPVGLLLLALGVLGAALPGAAQPRGTLPVVGVLAPDTSAVLAHPTSDLSRCGRRTLVLSFWVRICPCHQHGEMSSGCSGLVLRAVAERHADEPCTAPLHNPGSVRDTCNFRSQ